MKLTSLAALFALSAEAASVVSWKSAVTEGYWDDTANWGAYDPSNIDNWFRVDLSNKTVPYVLTITNRQEFIGLVNLKLNGSVPYGVTLDISNGVLKQVDGDGASQICTGDPFSIWSNEFGPGALYLSASSHKQNSFIMSNTVVKASRTLDENGAATFCTSFTGGYVSFAEPNASNTANILQSQGNTDAVRDMVFDHVEMVLPQFKPRSGMNCGMVWFKGGKCDILSDVELFANARDADGTCAIKVTDGAHVTHHGVGNIVFGLTSQYDRQYVIEVAGEGSVYSNMAGTYTLNGQTAIRVRDGGTFVMDSLPAPYRYVYLGKSAGSCAAVSVDGANSVIDATQLGSFNVLNTSTITVSNGGTFILPTYMTSLGSNDAANNDVTVTVRGEGSRLVCPQGCELAVGDRVSVSTRATLNVEGGYVGATNETDGYVFYIGKNANTTGILNISGGEVRGGYGNFVHVGNAGSGALNVSGGAFYVYKTLSLGSGASSTSETSSFRQTGGYVRAGDGVLVCGGSGENDRVCTVSLEGGVLEASNIYGGSGRAGGGTATVKADGGTLKAIVTRTGDYPFIYSLDSFTIGSRGFTIDTAGFDELVTQPMGDATGEKGMLRKVGEGALVFETGAYSVATTVVARGALSFRDAEPAFSTALTVTNGAALSLSGTPAALTLDALTIDGATLELDAGDVITVNGPASIRDLTLKMAAAPEPKAANPFIVCNGEIDADSKAALRRAYCGVAHSAGYHGSFRADYDQNTGKTTIYYESVPDGAPLTGDDVTVYNGTDGVWSTAGSWSSGLPDETKKASFTDASAAKNVTAPSGALVGALGFGAGDVTLGGGPVEIAAEEGSAEIEVASGSATVTAPLVLDAHKVSVPVAAGASLDLAGGVADGGLEKSGAGHLTISGAGAFLFPSAFGSGVTTLAHADALGGAPSLSLTGGTLETTAAGVTLPKTTVGVDATSVQIFKTEVDTTVRPEAIKGAFIKRGAGKMTIDLTGAANTMSITTAGKGTGTTTGLPGNAGTQHSFPADGSAPADGGFTGFTVAEGELVLKDDPATRKEHWIDSTVFVGMMTKDGTADPVLTVDGAYINNHHTGCGHFWVGRNVGHANTFMRSATLRVINGGYLKVDTPQFGSDSSPATSHQVTVALTNGTLYGGFTLHWSNYEGSANPVRIRAKDSAIMGNGEAVYLKGCIDADLDNTYVGKTATTPGRFWVQTWSVDNMTGSIALRNKSVFNISSWNNINKIIKPFTVSFDDSYYRWGGGDFTLEMKVQADTTANPEKFKLEMRGRGMIVAPEEGETLTIAWPLTGEGGFVHEGDGTVVFANDMYKFSGVCEVASGTLDLSGAGQLETPSFRGGGTVKGLSAAKATLDVDLDDSAVLTLSDASIGRVCVDLGCTTEAPLDLAELPQNVLVARLSGATNIPASAFRLRGTGVRGLVGRFSVGDGGEVRMTVERTGVSIILR